MQPAVLRWRDATDADAAFLGQLDASLSGWLDAVAGLDEPQRAALLAMQAQARAQAYASAWPEARCQLVERSEPSPPPGPQAIGRVWTAQRGGELHLLDISLMPQVRGQGVGTACMQRLVAQAAQQGLDLTLDVAEDNPALRLYRRLGFEQVARYPPYLHLLLKPR